MLFRLSILLLLLFCTAPLVLADPPEAVPEALDFSQRSKGERAETLEDLTEEEALELRPMLQSIRLALLTQRATLSDLDERRSTTTNPEVRAKLDREVARVKMGTERRLLEIQLEYALAEGRATTAETLQNALQTLDEDPQPTYQDRSQPDARR